MAGSMSSAAGTGRFLSEPGTRMTPMIGQLHSVVLDAPDAHALATFYARLLGMEVKGSPGDDWIVITGAGYRIAFQQAPDLRPPDWPDPDRPQQFHLDIRLPPVFPAQRGTSLHHWHPHGTIRGISRGPRRRSPRLIDSPPG